MAAKGAKVAVESEGAITIVSIDRFAEARNAVDPETAGLLRDAFLAFDKDETQSVAILTGRGGTFCAGFDLKVAAARAGSAIHDPEGPGPMGPTRHLLSKPVIAAVEGYAVAGGLELALWCDLRVASESAKFGVFCRRWGVPLIDGGTVRLPRLIGIQPALQLMAEGTEVSPQKALAMGLVNELAAGRDELIAKARAWATANPKAKAPWDQPKFRFPGGDSRSPAVAQVFAIGPSIASAKSWGNYPAIQHIMSSVFGQSAPYTNSKYASPE